MPKSLNLSLDFVNGCVYIVLTSDDRLQMTGKERLSITLFYSRLRDGPLENLWGGGGAGEVQKKNSRKGKLNEKKFLQAN